MAGKPRPMAVIYLLLLIPLAAIGVIGLLSAAGGLIAIVLIAAFILGTAFALWKLNYAPKVDPNKEEREGYRERHSRF